jgi:penicillin-binding protein 1C
MRRLALAGLSLLWLGAAVGALLDHLFPPDLSRLAVVGTEVLDRQDRPLALLPAPGGVWRFSATPEQVSPLLTDLLVAVEDRRFWLHPGVDPLALVRATGQLLLAGHVVSGGSTLAMQAARLLQPRPRTLRSKLIEMARAVQLEMHYGRRGVLQAWLTLAPFGGNLEGVRAGSLAWFGTPAEALEPAQAALLVAIPRRPEALRPDRHLAAAQAVRARVLAVGARAGLFDAATTEAAPIPATRSALPRHAPQLVAGLPRAPLLHATLDLPLQAALERLGQDRLQTLPPRVSLAMLVVDADTREIRAAFAGAWRDTQRAGALDLTRAVRSPGSALKPFIYAMAFADGSAAPDTILADLPRHFGGYAPENFDRGFAGSITAGEALRRSLNLPAVTLLDQVGPLRFAATLKQGGATLRLPRGADASLPLALGGDGITLRQAVGLYAALATDGSGAPLRLLADDPTDHRPFLPPVAAAEVAAVLTHPFPGFGPRGIAWKTGTSWGGRDAWALGFDARNVAGVWIGRPDGTPMPGATGAALALPLLGRVFDLLPQAPRDTPPASPPPTRRNTVTTDALRLLFPPQGAVLSADGPVTLRAMGGRRPLSFLVDGAPLPAEPARRETAWLPPGPGFYRVTVLDADGAAAHVAVQVRTTQ